MNDFDALTPDQERSVRQRLAAARHTAPPPAALVARWEETIAALQAERSSAGGVAADLTTMPALQTDGSGPDPAAANPAASDPTGSDRAEAAPLAPVVALAPRRPWVPRLLVAAAVVGVIGVGLPPLMRSLTAGGEDSMSADAGGDATADRSINESGSMIDSSAGQPEAEEAAPTPELPVVRERALRKDARDILAATKDAYSSALGDDSLAESQVLGTGCSAPAESSRVKLVQLLTLDGELLPAMVVRIRDDSGRRTEVWVCGEAEPRASFR